MPTLDSTLVTPGSRASLAHIDPAGTLGIAGKDQAEQELAEHVKRLAELQYVLWAQNKHSLLVVLQGMDTSGKDGVIRHVFSGINPQGCSVVSFKAPTPLELDHDFLWRVHQAVPAKGEIVVFNRSHYEDVLIVRVKGLVPESVWRARYERINTFERLLAESAGTTILKFFLHISKDEQRERLEARLRDPAKCWKFNPGDLVERTRWDEYQHAYEDAIHQCSTAHAPWHIVPANRKWVRNLAIARVVRRELESLKMSIPAPAFDLSTIRVV